MLGASQATVARVLFVIELLQLAKINTSNATAALTQIILQPSSSQHLPRCQSAGTCLFRRFIALSTVLVSSAVRRLGQSVLSVRSQLRQRLVHCTREQDTRKTGVALCVGLSNEHKYGGQPTRRPARFLLNPLPMDERVLRARIQVPEG